MVLGTGGYNLGSAYGRIVLSPDGVADGINEAKRQVDGGLKGIGDSVANLGGAFTALTAPLLAFGAAGLKVAADFDTAMAEISARTGLVGADLEEIRQLALQMGADTAFSAQDAADALLQLLSSGQTAKEAIATLPAVLTAAAASGAALGETADTVTDIMATFGLEAQDAAMIVDAMARASGASSATMNDLGQAFRGVGGIAKRFGIDVNETASILAIFAENGVKGSQAGQLLETMLTQMSRDTNEANEAWAELGTTLYDAQGNTRPFVDVINDLKNAMKNLPVRDQNRLIQALAGSYGQAGLSALLGSISIEDMNARMAGSASSADIAQKRMETFSGRVESLKGSVETLMIQAITPLMNEVLAPLVEQITKVVNSVTDWIVANPELAKQIGKVLAVVVTIGPALLVAGKAIALVGGLLTALASPVVLVVAAIGALVWAFQNNFLGIRDTLQPVIDQITGGIETLIGVFGRIGEIVAEQGIGSAIDYVLNAFAQMFGLVGSDEFFEPLRGIGDKIMTVILTIAQAIDTFGKPAIEAFFGAIEQAWVIIQPGLEALSRWFTQDALPTVVNFVQSVVVPAIQLFVQILTDIWNKVAPFLANLFNWFTIDALPAITNFLNNTVIPAVQGLIDRLSGFWTAIQPGLQSFFNWVTADALPLVVDFFENVIQPVIDTFIDVLLTIWDTISPALGDVFNWFMTDGLPFITDVIQGAMDNFITPFINLLKGIWDAIKPTFDALKTNLLGWFEWVRDNVWNPLISKIQGVIDFINDLLTKLGLVQSQSSSMDAINSGLEGTPLDPGSYGIPGYASGLQYVPHEMLVKVHPGEGILTASANRERMMGNSSGGDTIVLNVPLEVLRDEPRIQQNADSFAQRFMERKRRNGQ